MTRISTIFVLSCTLAVLALSAYGASAATINVSPVHVVVSPPPKNTSHGTTSINHINEGVGSASPKYFQSGPTSETIKEATTPQGTTGINHINKRGDKPPPSYPQGIQDHTDGTVTIDGKTMPLNKTAEKYMRQASTPPPKMWVGNQLVPITPANEKKAQELALSAHR